MLSDEYECEESILGKILCILFLAFSIGAIAILGIVVFLRRGEADRMVGISMTLMGLATFFFAPICTVACRKKEKERVRYIPY